MKKNEKLKIYEKERNLDCKRKEGKSDWMKIIDEYKTKRIEIYWKKKERINEWIKSRILKKKKVEL